MGVLKAHDPLLYESIINELYSEDFLGKLEQLITQNVSPPYSISINGTWGSGKTTLLKLLEKRLIKGGYPVVWFNPWEYERMNDVVMAFLQQIVFQFSQKFNLNEKELGIFAISLFTAGIDTVARFFSGGNLSYENVKNIVQDVNKEYRDEYESFNNIVEKIKEDFSNITYKIWKNHNNKPLIIFFDDLDRCLPEKAIDLLEALKNLFVVKGAKVIFISGIDTWIAKQFIIQRYGDISRDFALNYFRKIFNLTIDIPRSSSLPIDKLIENYIKDLFKDMKFELYLSGFIGDIIDLARHSETNSLRSIINVINNFYTLWIISDKKLYYDRILLALLFLKELWNDFFQFMVASINKTEGKSLFNFTYDNQLLRDKYFSHDPRLRSFMENEMINIYANENFMTFIKLI